ncbi:hypothetical protein [Paramagnetospirillum magneticum]|uniref:hypothetical protein n=1 Tax=Paramagnetospirillum magneticum TaxID=84159 RepID=UPI0011D15402|nr:hypothetical protein [Paramagnetospirillum magneticum]
MKVVIVVRSVTLRNALSFVRDNLGGEISYITNGKIISIGVGAAYGIKQTRKTDTYRKAKLNFIVADVVSDDIVYIKMKFHQSMNKNAELVTALPYDKQFQAIDYATEYRKNHKDRNLYPRGWQAIFRDKLLELMPSIKICYKSENTVRWYRRYEAPDCGCVS